MTEEHDSSGCVAIVGMSGRFPGARDLDAFWHNLVHGVDSISHFRDSELEVSCFESAEDLLRDNYVKARGILDDVDLFDSQFFGFTPRDAAVMDPQHRIFLEAAWSTLESAGYDPMEYAGSIGVWASMSNPTYYLENVLRRPDIVRQVGLFHAMLLNEKDYLATRVSYKLHLRGPSINVYTACSSSLVAVCQAFQALLTFQCDMALAGGVSVTIPQHRGHLHQEGAIGSRDGRCCPFDEQASGTLFSDGLGVVLLKRLDDALADRDEIWAVLRGAAVNNDGAAKVSYTAPSVNGQTEVILMAQEIAGVAPETISYVEAHGTATPVGDPIEFAALTQAFRRGTTARQFCALGSVKSNIGHLDAAAGIAGLIKTVLALRHRVIPPTAHFVKSNPAIDLETSPFSVNADARDWTQSPRIAGVSSFGIGGTNAHVVLEEAPQWVSERPRRGEHLLVLSARTSTALATTQSLLAAHLEAHPELNLADVAYTLQVGRRAFNHRLAVACSSVQEAISVLGSSESGRLSSSHRGKVDARVAFLFPGQGSQRAGMAAELYSSEPVYAAVLDRCALLFEPHLGLDIRSLLFSDGAADRLSETEVAQPLLFATELALARLWMSWGIVPAEMIGHSLGEFVAGCIAEVFTEKQAALIVAHRSRLMQAQPRGSMMAVRLSVEDLQPWLEPGVMPAAINAPDMTVVSGPTVAIKAMEARLSKHEIGCKLLATSHAFHSSMMDGALDAFRQVVSSVSLQPPRMSWISCVTGKRIMVEQAMNPDYWVRQLREPVMFSDGITLLSQDPELVFLEVGPGHALSALVQMHRDRPNQDKPVVTSLPREHSGDVRLMLDALGRLWSAGVKVGWSALHSNEKRRRVSLPTYPYERTSHWLKPSQSLENHLRAVAVDSGAAGHDNEEPHPVASNSPSTMVALPDANDDCGVQRRLRQLISNSTGIAPGSIDVSKTHLEIGFDSLTLTQFGVALQKEFGCLVTLRQLLEDVTTPRLLVDYIKTRTPNNGHSTTMLNKQDAQTPGRSPAKVATTPPVPGARLGRDANGLPAWFVPDPSRPGKYLQLRGSK